MRYFSTEHGTLHACTRTVHTYIPVHTVYSTIVYVQRFTEVIYNFDGGCLVYVIILCLFYRINY